MATPEGPARKRESWSLKNLVEDISGKPIGDFQDPARPTHPYLRVKIGGTSPVRVPARTTPRDDGPSAAELDATPTNPVDRVYPPLTGSTGRSLHGPEFEHHAATLATVRAGPEPPTPGRVPHLPGPSTRPERIYLHYLLLHMDRLGDPALRYLKHAVDEELQHRESSVPDPSTP
jgi:hypothetical protein